MSQKSSRSLGGARSPRVPPPVPREEAGGAQQQALWGREGRTGQSRAELEEVGAWSLLPTMARPPVSRASLVPPAARASGNLARPR